MTSALRDWKKGIPVKAKHLQEPIDAIRDLREQLRALGGETQALDLDQGEVLPVVEWVFVEKTTETERIEDATDPAIYIDVERTTTVTVETPDGTYIRIQLEDLDA